MTPELKARMDADAAKPLPGAPPPRAKQQIDAAKAEAAKPIPPEVRKAMIDRLRLGKEAVAKVLK